LSVRVTVAPESGKANSAVCVTVAKSLGVPKTSVTVVRGATSRHKLLDIASADEAMLIEAFGAPPEALF